jgi:hypothetical protein
MKSLGVMPIMPLILGKYRGTAHSQFLCSVFLPKIVQVLNIILDIFGTFIHKFSSSLLWTAECISDNGVEASFSADFPISLE